MDSLFLSPTGCLPGSLFNFSEIRAGRFRAVVMSSRRNKFEMN